MPAQIVTPPQSQVKAFYSLVRLTCEAQGTPEPNITWYKDDILIPDQRLPFYVIPEMDLEDRAFYHCMAENMIVEEMEDGSDVMTRTSDTSEKVVINIKSK